MGTVAIHNCNWCGSSGDEKYVSPCYFCKQPVCTSCASWLQAKQETNRGTYHTVNRICPDCRPTDKI